MRLLTSAYGFRIGVGDDTLYAPLLEQMEQLVAQLEPSDQLKLVAHICEHLSMEGGEGKDRRAELAVVERWLADCDAVAGSIEGKFDSAKDLREIREERTNRA